jgi:hypothetical protein
MVQPGTVIAWQHRRFRDHWTRLCRQGQRGRPQIAPQLRDLIRRECLSNVVVLHQRHLRRLLTAYFQHDQRWRCHQALVMDCPRPRPVQGHEQGTVVEVAEGDGLYRHYERRAA